MNFKKKRTSRRGFLFFLIFIFLAAAAFDAYYFYFFEKSIAKIIPNNAFKKEYAVFCVGDERPDNCYWFDGGGIILREAKTIIGEVILKINEVSIYKPSLGKVFINSDLFHNLVPIIEFLKAKDITASDISLSREDQQVKLTTPENLQILFSLRFSPKNNIEGLKELLTKKKTSGLSYIDLRADNKIFYK